MNKRNHNLAIALICSGICIILVTLAVHGFDVRKFSNESEYVQQTYETVISQANIEHIQIDADHTSIQLIAGNDDQIHIVYDENDTYYYDIEVKNGILSMDSKENKHWYDYVMAFDFNFKSERNITLAIPSTYAGALDIQTSYQSISTIPLQELQSAKFKTEHASLTMANIKTNGDLSFVSSYASIKLENMVSNGRFAAQNEHGELQVKQVQSVGSSNLKTSYASLYIDGLTSEDAITIHNEHGQSDVNNIQGTTLDVATSYRSLKANTLAFSQDVRLHNEHNDIELNNATIQGNVNISTSYGDMLVTSTTIAKDATTSNEHGMISLQDVQVANALKAETSFDHILLQQVDAFASSLYNAHGDIDGILVGSLTDYAITSDINNGDNSLPKNKTNGNRKLHASTSYGDINISFDDEQ